MSSEKLHWKWEHFQTNINESFKKFRDSKDFCDVTLVSVDNVQIEAHRVILAAASPFFMELLRNNPHSHPLIYMRGVKANDLAAVVDFIYNGETQLNQDYLEDFIGLAGDLQLKGLTGVQFMEKQTQTIKIETTTVDKSESSQDNKLLYGFKGIDVANTEVNKSVTSDISTKFDKDDTLEEKIESMIENIMGYWTCNICEKGYRSKRDTKRHAETHLEGISHACKQCGRFFRTSNALRSHKKNNH